MKMARAMLIRGVIVFGVMGPFGVVGLNGTDEPRPRIVLGPQSSQRRWGSCKGCVSSAHLAPSALRLCGIARSLCEARIGLSLALTPRRRNDRTMRSELENRRTAARDHCPGR